MKTVVNETLETLCIYVFGLFNSTFSSSDCIAENVMINENDLERMWKEMVMT